MSMASQGQAGGERAREGAATDEVAAALAAHDAALVARGLDVWIGGEPTFTDRHSQAAAWHHQAMGGDKERRARALLARLVRPGEVVLRTVGRQYPGEERPRFSLGRWGRRDGQPVWSGPPDPMLLLAGRAPPGSPHPDASASGSWGGGSAPRTDAGASASGSWSGTAPRPDAGAQPDASGSWSGSERTNAGADPGARGTWSGRARTGAGDPDAGASWSAPRAGPDASASRGRSDAGAARLRDALAARLVARGWSARSFDLAPGPGPSGAACPQLLWRVVARPDGGALPDEGDARLARPPIGSGKLPEGGLEDELAAQGALLLAAGPCAPREDATDGTSGSPDASGAFVARDGGDDDDPLDPPGAVRLDLPATADPAAFAALLADVGAAAREAGLPALVLGGFPPPVDASVAHETVTPDPGVVEVNMAPCRGAAELLAAYHALFAAAAAEGLSPVRMRYTGEVGDSGGGGQLTLGGPSPAASPFFRAPRLLPGLVAYAARHPALSYLWNVDSVGSASQSPRADEGAPETWEELPLALARLVDLAAQVEAAPGDEALAARWRETLWSALAPLLADRFGNSHRAELNVEKLWNPGLPHRGRLGLVELRALRMARTPERAGALAALWRALAARLAQAPLDATVAAWGPQLHDRFLLPTLLREDLLAVLADLRAAGLGLGPALEAELQDDEEQRLVGRVEHAGRVLEVRRALEPWPLVGDALAQERGTARWVDASTTRLEVLVRPSAGAAFAPAPDELLVAARDGALVRVPLRPVDLASGPAALCGLRLRAFVPRLGLHPTVPAHGPLRLVWSPPLATDARAITLHDWRPQGGAYDGLPRDAADARARREERFAVEPAPPAAPARAAPTGAVTPWTLDLRWLG